jgi:hypothetical protein
VKYWLIVFFFTPNGEFIEKKEFPFKDEASCYLAMDKVEVKRPATIAEMVCVSDDHYRGRKQDPGVPYD